MLVATRPKPTRKRTSKDVVSADMWGNAVVRWNALNPTRKREERAICLNQGHDFRETDIGQQMCFRCCEWKYLE